MSTKYKFWDNRKLYFVSYAVVGWIDLFTRKEYREIVADSWNFCTEKRGLEIYAWVIMPSHVPMIVGSHGEPLDKIFADMKRYTSRQLHKLSEGSRESGIVNRALCNSCFDRREKRVNFSHQCHSEQGEEPENGE